MGMITIESRGSFPTRRKEFGAITHGHAHAVQEAIAYLVDEMLPAAINKDHQLHDEGAAPTQGFEKSS